MRLLARIIITPQALAIVCVGVFLFAATFSMTLGMQTDERGDMAGCPFMTEQTLVCQMGVFEHIAKWQQIFTAAFSQSNDFAFIIFLFLTFVFLAVFARAPNILSFVLALPPSVFKNRPETKLYNHLVIIFSQGILNPRLYA